VAEILVEFVPDFTKLESGVDKLVNDNTISKEMAALFTDAGKSLDQFGAKFAKLGGGTTLKPAIDAAKKSISSLATSGIKDLGELKKRVDGITNSFTEGFGQGVKEALDEAGVSLEDFNKQLKLTDDTQKTLKQSLRDTTEQLAEMKLNGQENTQQYQELTEKAGLYRDALKDVTQEINRTASDTRKLDTAIEFVQGIAGAFAIMQGAIALAGDESEDFQKTLLKVNAAMSIFAGF
jgi:chromosome segregation ATPase